MVEACFGFVVGITFLTHFVLQVIHLAFKGLYDLVQGITAWILRVTPLELAQESIGGELPTLYLDLPLVSGLLADIQELPINLLQQRFQVVFQLDEFVVHEHQSVEVAHLELLAFQVDLGALAYTLLGHTITNLLDSGGPTVLHEWRSDEEKSH